MRHVFTSAAQDFVAVALADGETLGNFAGPANLVIPWGTQAERNAEFQASLALGIAPEAFMPPPPPVPAQISRPQCAMEMAARGLISPAEMVAMAQTGAPPAFVQAALATRLDEPDLSFAIAHFARYTYDRADPMLNDIMMSIPIPDGAGGMRAPLSADVDQFFRDAAAR